MVFSLFRNWIVADYAHSLSPLSQVFSLFLQLLKLYYRAPQTSPYHQQVWTKIGARAEPLIHRFAPPLVRPLDYVKNWFHS